VNLTEIMRPQDETPAPADHLMASACLAEMRAIYPPGNYQFSPPLFAASRTLGQVVRIDYEVAAMPNEATQVAARFNRLVCFQQPEQAKLEMYLFTGMALDPRDDTQNLRIETPPFHN
jgi:hypothetical protein